MIKINDLKVYFKSFHSGQIPVIDIEEYSFNKNDFHIIMGRSGNGKTTLLNVITGMLEPSQGSIMINDLKINELTSQEKNTLRRELVSYVPQFPHLFHSMNSFENVSFALITDKNKFKTSKDLVLRLFEKFKVSYLIEKYPSELSGGEKAIISIIRGLVREPEILICDEPVSQLHISRGREVLEKLYKWGQDDKLVLITSHNPVVHPKSSVEHEISGGKLILKEK